MQTAPINWGLSSCLEQRNVEREHALAAGFVFLTALIIATGRQRHAFALQCLCSTSPNLSASRMAFSMKMPGRLKVAPTGFTRSLRRLRGNGVKFWKKSYLHFPMPVV